MKIKILVEAFTPSLMTLYAEVCGWTLARAHARSGAPATISGYLGKSEVFDTAIAAFSAAYADQCERDHAVLMKEVRKGRLKVITEQAAPWRKGTLLSCAVGGPTNPRRTDHVHTREAGCFVCVCSKYRAAGSRIVPVQRPGTLGRVTYSLGTINTRQ